MKRQLLLSLLAIIFMSAVSIGQTNKAFKIHATEEAPVYLVAHIAESPSVAAYRGDNDPDSSMVVNPLGPWTVEVWVKPEVLGMNYLLLTGGNTQFRLQEFTSHPGSWWAGIDFDAVGIGTLGKLDSGAEWDEVFGDPAYKAEVGEWQHCAIINDGWSIRMIVNGVNEYYYTNYNNTDEDYTGYDAMAYGIGDNGTGWMPTASCEIDNYRVWNIARENEEVLADMKLSVPSNTTGLIANYTFDNDPADTIINTAATGRNMVFDADAVAAVSYVPSTAPQDMASLHKLKSSAISVYPNPASDYIRVNAKFKTNEPQVLVFDALGNTVIKSTLKQNMLKLNNLKTGLYILQVKDQSTIHTSKFSVK